MKKEMSVEKFTKIQKTIEQKKQEINKATGVIESIEKSWFERLGFSSIEKVGEKITELKEEIEKHKNSLYKLTDKLENITDWRSI